MNRTKTVINSDKFAKKIKGKKILYLATKKLDYIRCNQEINLIKEYSREYKIIGSYYNSYFLRTLYVYLGIIFLSFIYKPEIVFVGFAPQLLFPFYIVNFFMRDTVIITDLFISLYDTLVNDRKVIQDKSLFAKLCHAIDSSICFKSALIIADTEAHATFFQNEFKQPREKFLVIYLVPDKLFFSLKSAFRPKEISAKFVVLYFGSYLPLQGVNIILSATKKLLDVKNIHFILIGPVNKLKIDPRDFSNVTFINWLPQDQLARYISMADLCLAGHFDDSICKAKRTIPGKAYIYQAMGKPMILGNNPANHELFISTDSNNIYFVPMGDPQSLADLIVRIYKRIEPSNETK